MEGLQAREVERDCVCAIEGWFRTDGWGWGRADEPCGRGAVWGNEGGAADGGYSCGVRCILSVPGRSRSYREGWCNGDHSAGRIGSRRGSGRGGKPAGYRYGYDGVATLQARIKQTQSREFGAIIASKFGRLESKDE